MQLRPETTADHAAIRGVVGRAFAHQPEVPDLVEAIRASEHYVPDLALVATEDDTVIGFVMASYAELHDEQRRRRVLTLSPLAVDPPHQRTGVGTALVHALADRADVHHEPLLALEGDPRYYGRLGFEPSVPLGIHLELPSWAPPEAGQVRRLRSYDPAIRGRLHYPAAFDLVAEH